MEHRTELGAHACDDARGLRPTRLGCKARGGHGPTNGTTETHIQVRSRAIDSGGEEQGKLAAQGSSHGVIMEASPVNEHQPNGVVERAFSDSRRHGPNSQPGA